MNNLHDRVDFDPVILLNASYIIMIINALISWIEKRIRWVNFHPLLSAQKSNTALANPYDNHAQLRGRHS